MRDFLKLTRCSTTRSSRADGRSSSFLPTSTLWIIQTVLAITSAGVWVDQLAEYPWGASNLVPLLTASTVGFLSFVALFRMLGEARRPVLAVVAAFNVLSALALFVPTWSDAVGKAEAPADTGRTIRVLTANLWNNYSAIPRFVDLVRSEQPDLLFVQEAYEPWRTVLEQELPEYKRAAGCAYKHTCNSVVYHRVLAHRLIQDDGKGYVAAQVTWAGEHELRTITLAGAHISRSKPKRAQQELSALVQELAGADGPVIIAGDFNMSPWDPRLRELQERFDLRIFSGLANSWPTHSRLGIQRAWLPIPGVSIDHVLASEHFVRVGKARRLDFGSDHFAVFVEMQVSAD